MDRVLDAIIGPRWWPRSLLIKAISFITFIVLAFVATQIWSQTDHKKGVEKTLRTIEENDRCKVTKVIDSVVNSKVKMTSEVNCTKSGKHLLSGIKLPPYFKKENNEVQTIFPEEYE